MKIGILGTGTWGIALARMLSLSGYSITAWSAIEQEIDILNSTRIHPNLPDAIIPDTIEFSKNIDVACDNKDVIVIAVPSNFVRSTVLSAKPFITETAIIVSVTKGIESDTLMTMTDVIKDVLDCQQNVVALSGPTHAEEVAADKPTTIVSACDDLAIAEIIQNIFMNTNMRVYTNVDIKGVQLCGALKNIIALAAGISNGLGYGDNATAAIITRGMAEVTRLGLKMGCMQETFYGLSGIGDMIVTATSQNSRNFRAGQLIGQGYSVNEAITKVKMVVEGINALPAAIKLMHKFDVYMPIISAVDDVVKNNKLPSDAVEGLMCSPKKSELSKSPLVINFEKAILDNKGDSNMKRVITYGTFDLLHYGHINLLKRAKALGDYLIVVVSTDEFNWNEKQKKCYFTYEQRKALVEAIRYVDLVIPETSWEQKRSDIHEYHVDTFVMGDDWKGKFDFLKEEGAEVVYLPRTPEISTTQIKADLHK